jgi:hypothetical protein
VDRGWRSIKRPVTGTAAVTAESFFADRSRARLVSRDTFAQFQQGELAKWGKAVRDAGVEVD